jgi:hypothetical protein
VVDQNGGVRTKRLDEDPAAEGVAIWYWASLPGDPEGAYAVSVQGYEAEASFRVVGATKEALLVYLRSGNDVDTQYVSGPAGSIVGVALAGFAPGSQVDLHFYGPDDSRTCTAENCPSPLYPYISTVPVPVDSRGQAVYEFTSGPDTVGRFCVLAIDSGVESDPAGEGPCPPKTGVFTLE